jgi:hypothetical protein
MATFLQIYVVLCTDPSMTSTMRMPITAASRKGISAVAAASHEQRSVLTSHGRVIAVLDSASLCPTGAA